jgi:hypothetical protein
MKPEKGSWHITSKPHGINPQLGLKSHDSFKIIKNMDNVFIYR